MTSKKILIVFPKSDVSNPVINDLIKSYDLTISILRAQITPEEEGHMLIDMIGAQNDIDAGMEFIKSHGNQIYEEADKGMQWDQDKCMQCGNCISHCPTNALAIVDRETMRVDFDSNECIECLNCIKNCPYGACSSVF